MNSRRPDRWEEEDDRDRYRRDDRDEDRDRRSRQYDDEDDRDRRRRYDEDDRDRRRRYDEEDDRSRRRRFEDEDDYREHRPSRRYEDEDDRNRPRRPRRKPRSGGNTALWVIVTLLSMVVLGGVGFLIYYLVFSGGSTRDRLVGRWTGTINGNQASLVFNESGTWALAGNGVSFSGKWTVQRSFGGIVVRINNDTTFGPGGQKMRAVEHLHITFINDNEIRIEEEEEPSVSWSVFTRQGSFPRR